MLLCVQCFFNHEVHEEHKGAKKIDPKEGQHFQSTANHVNLCASVPMSPFISGDMLLFQPNLLTLQEDDVRLIICVSPPFLRFRVSSTASFNKNVQ